MFATQPTHDEVMNTLNRLARGTRLNAAERRCLLALLNAHKELPKAARGRRWVGKVAK